MGWIDLVQLWHCENSCVELGMCSSCSVIFFLASVVNIPELVTLTNNIFQIAFKRACYLLYVRGLAFNKKSMIKLVRLMVILNIFEFISSVYEEKKCTSIFSSLASSSYKIVTVSLATF